MAYVSAEFGIDRSRVTVVSVCRDPGWRDAGARFGGGEEPPRGRHIACLAQPHVHQRSRCVDGTIEVAPAALNFDVGFVNVPAPANLTASLPPAQTVGERLRELGFPVADRFVSEHDAADQDHLSQITEAQLVAQTP